MLIESCSNFSKAAGFTGWVQKEIWALAEKYILSFNSYVNVMNSTMLL